jgi:NAD(P)-dependent dehydrogenase (short-subunit alcohol dehydrogenase family)
VTIRTYSIPGASSGLGLALTRRVLARGDRVIATARPRGGKTLKERFADAAAARLSTTLSEERSVDEDDGDERLRLLELDVSAPFEEVQRQAEAAIALWGRVDVVVNNAGFVGDEIGPSEELGCVLCLFSSFSLASALSAKPLSA